MPQRIKRRRSRGWRLPAGVAYVGRPGQFGNPWAVVHTADRSAFTVVRKAGRRPDLEVCPYRGSHHASHEGASRWAVEAFRRWTRMTPSGRRMAQAAREQLRGRDLACWCDTNKPCHADVLLEIANPPSEIRRMTTARLTTPPRLTHAERDLLEHTLGMTGNKRSVWGYRNYYCSKAGGENHATLEGMVSQQLMTVGRGDQSSQYRYYHATRKGCEAVGMHKAAIRRAFAP